jgi:GH24 family phage-related lysozyme (muramidase)
VKLTQYQHDALVSFSYNLGAYIWPQASTLVSDIKANASADVLKQDFGAFCHCNGQVIPGLVTRRLDEWKLYTTGDYGNS